MARPQGVDEAARGFTAAGVRVVGCRDDKKPRAAWDWCQSADPAETLPHALGAPLLGVLTGDRFDVVDVDAPDALADLQRLHGAELLPPCYGVAVTRSGGWHIYVPALGRGNGTDLLSTARAHGNVDYRGKGGFVIAPPSPGWEWAQPLNLDAVIDPEPWRRLLDAADAARKAAQRLQAAPSRPRTAAAPSTSATGPLDARRRAYAVAALESMAREHAAMAPETGRNNHLNASAMRAGHWCPKYLDPDEIQHALAEAARQAGTEGASATIESGLAAGMADPTDPPVSADAGRLTLDRPELDPLSQAEVEGVDEVAPRRTVRITWADSIEPAPVVWAWREPDQLGRIPSGSLSIAAGREGTGKSSFGIWLAAKITRGALPGAFHGKPRRVFYLAVEDSWKYTLVPRLMAAGADLARVGRLDVITDDGQEVTLSLPSDNSMLEAEAIRHGVALIVIDPLMSVIGEKIDTHREREVRMALDPLAKLADTTAAIVLGIAHFNKSNGTDTASLITGSGAFKNVPRTVFGFAKDDQSGNRVMSQVKNSLGQEDLPSLEYRISSEFIDTPTGVTETGRFEWIGETDRSVSDVLRSAGRGDDTDDDEGPAEWLREYLEGVGGEAGAVEVYRAGRAAGDFSKDQLKRAKKATGVRSCKASMGSGWTWQLTEGSTKGAKSAGNETPPPSLPSALPSGERITCRACLEPLDDVDGIGLHPSCSEPEVES